MEVIGRVESGTETESNAGRLYGYRRLKMSGTNFPAVAEDVRSLRTPVLSRHFRHPWRAYVAAAWTSVPPLEGCAEARR
jgi:hypothetical protein